MKFSLKSALKLVAVSAIAVASVLPVAAEEAPSKQAEFYKTETLHIDDDAFLEVSGLAMMPGERLAILTRRGELWIADNAESDDPEGLSYRKFADGLHEPLGLAYMDGWLYVTQRSELTRIKDSTGDGKADVFETVYDGWGVSGDYHEFAFGSVPDKDGNIWVVLCLTDSKTSEAFLRGWTLKISPDGKMTPMTSGVRSPGGIGMAASGEMFFTENQGFWVGSSALKHLKPGSFQGAPPGNKWYDSVDMGPKPADPEPETTYEEARADIPQLVPPAVVFPHGRVGQSPTGMVWDNTDGRFGPFPEQLFVGEYTHSQIQRVFLEEVNGVQQGAVFPFMDGFASGNISVIYDSKGRMLVGGLSRGWPTRGGTPYALQRVSWTGKTPFEIKEMRVTKDGFDLEFTKPVDKKTAASLASYQMDAWTYLYRELYGSPEVYQEQPEITKATVSEDGLTVSLEVPDRIKGHIHMLTSAGVRAATGEPLLHDLAYYTLNEIPE